MPINGNLLLEYSVWQQEPIFYPYIGWDAPTLNSRVYTITQSQPVYSTNYDLGYLGGIPAGYTPGIDLDNIKRQSTFVEIVEALYVTKAEYNFRLFNSNGEIIPSGSYRQPSNISASKVRRSTICLTDFQTLDDPILLPFPAGTIYNQSYSARASNWSIGSASNVPDVLANIAPYGYYDLEPNGYYARRIIKESIADDVRLLLYEFPTIVRFYKNEFPTYIDLLSGHPEDTRTIPDKPIIIPLTSEKLFIEYYSANHLESIPDLKTIDIRHYECDLVENVPYTLPVEKCVLGTLTLSIPSAKNQVVNSPTLLDKYPYKYYFGENLPELFAYWRQLLNITPLINSHYLLIIGANNNYWNNRPVSTANLNVDIGHPMCAIDSLRAYNWHVKPQSDGSYGDLVMDSPRTIETRLMIEQLLKALNALEYQNETPAIIGTGTIDNPETPATHKLDWYIKNSAGEKVTAIWKALGGNKYGTNSIDNTQERVTNLGFLVERIAKVLGIRFDDNGKIDVDKEKSIIRKVIDFSKDIDDKKVGVNSFGDDGMVFKRINNRFNKKGEIVSDQSVIVQDIPDLVQEYFEEANLALGIQQSSAIEIKQGNKVARFRSQLEILMELLNLLSSGNEMTRAALVSSLVTQSQTNELIAGLGLPSVTKTIPIKIGEKVTQLPFKGIAAHRSISQEIATATYNIGIVLGQVL